MRLLANTTLLLSILVSVPAVAGDADNGRRIALQRCSNCHIVTNAQRREVADSPPFSTIGQKYEFSNERIAAAVRDPHPRMNLIIGRAEADDIAAYIASLKP
jgi:mono/diheme cytochrome c family protein